MVADRMVGVTENGRALKSRIQDYLCGFLVRQTSGKILAQVLNATQTL